MSEVHQQIMDNWAKSGLLPDQPTITDAQLLDRIVDYSRAHAVGGYQKKDVRQLWKDIQNSKAEILKRMAGAA